MDLKDVSGPLLREAEHLTQTETTWDPVRRSYWTEMDEFRPFDSPVTGRSGDLTGWGRNMTCNYQDFLEELRDSPFCHTICYAYGKFLSSIKHLRVENLETDGSLTTLLINFHAIGLKNSQFG